MHGGQRSETEALANFPKLRRVTVLGLEGHEVIEDFFLPLVRAMCRLTRLDSQALSAKKRSERQAPFSLRYFHHSFRVPIGSDIRALDGVLWRKTFAFPYSGQQSGAIWKAFSCYLLFRPKFFVFLWLGCQAPASSWPPGDCATHMMLAHRPS